MRLDLFLVNEGLSETRSRAVHLIKTGNVMVNGVDCQKQSYNVKLTDKVEIKAAFKYVSRAGYKIEAIFSKLSLTATEKSVLDVGCSTGGFSDFFLQQDAAKVVGLDVARDIVDPRIIAHPRFRFYGGVDACDLNALRCRLLEEKFDIISVDVSNVLLKEVLPVVSAFLRSDGLILALFKPPYEAGRMLGLQEEADALTREFDIWLEERYAIVGKEISPLRGGAKNRGTMEIVYVLGAK
jgi:23S rRNA (cytidine1920-2'-O)/16S rRNA (cytidine1409-2'-O)-methyltransferase